MNRRQRTERKRIPNRPGTVKWVLASQYFFYFGVLGIYLPYFNLYCYHLGFTGAQIGALSALRTSATILFPLLWGILADRFQLRKPIYILASLLSATIWGFYLLTTDFATMAVITVFYGIFYAPVISFLEAFSMDLLGRDKQSYGRVRVWGSLNFIAAVLVVGRIIDMTSARIILPLILAGSWFQVLIAFRIPATTRAGRISLRQNLGGLANKRILVFLIAAFLMLASHGAYYGFFSIHLAELGYSTTFIGFAWALASMAEILVMVTSRRIFRRFALERVLLFSFLVAAVRWSVLYTAHSPLLILLTQVTHAITYGTFHIASILYMDELTPPESKTLGQAANNAVTYGLGMTVGFAASGVLFHRIGSFHLFLASGFLALLGGLIVAVLAFPRRPT